MIKLQNEKSPYLLKHLGNSVDWFHWGEGAVSRARKENRLVFFFIGYSKAFLALLPFAPQLKSLPTTEEKVTAYVCSKFSCQVPFADPQGLRWALGKLPE